MSKQTNLKERENENQQYEKSSYIFLEKLMQKLGGQEIGFITSPTTQRYSIDAVTTLLGQRFDIPTLYTTARDYLPYIDPKNKLNCDQRINYDYYLRQPKYFFENAEQYSEATALASNCCIVIGGREATISDVVKALGQGNRVVIYDDKRLPGETFANHKVQNASRYLITQYNATKRTTDNKDLPLANVGGLTAEILKKAKRQKQIKIVTSDDIETPEKTEEIMYDIRSFLDAKKPTRRAM